MISKTRYIFSLIVLMIIVVGQIKDAQAQTFSLPDQATTKTTIATTQVTGRGYALTTPQSWSPLKFNDDFVSLSLNTKMPYQPEVYITAELAKNPAAAKIDVEEAVKAAKSSEGFKKIAEGAVMISSYPGVEVTYQYSMGMPSHLTQVRQVQIVRGRVVYTFMYSALPVDFAKYAPDFDQMLQSMRWNKDNLLENVPSLQSVFGRMTNQVYSERASLGGKYVAVLAYHDGLTYGYEFLSLQVRAKWHPLRANDPIPADEVGEMGDEGITEITWAGPHTLFVRYDKSVPKDCFVKRARLWHDVRLIWKTDH